MNYQPTHPPPWLKALLMTPPCLKEDPPQPCPSPSRSLSAIPGNFSVQGGASQRRCIRILLLPCGRMGGCGIRRKIVFADLRFGEKNKKTQKKQKQSEMGRKCAMPNKTSGVSNYSTRRPLTGKILLSQKLNLKYTEKVANSVHIDKEAHFQHLWTFAQPPKTPKKNVFSSFLRKKFFAVQAPTSHWLTLEPQRFSL